MLARSNRASRLVTAATRSFSRWSGVEMGPKDPILGIQEAFVADKNPDKLSFGIGAYRDNDCKPVVLPSVKKAQQIVFDAPEYQNNEYAPIGGDPEYVRLSMELAYGPDFDLDRVCGLQALSGTGCLRLLAGFIKNHSGKALPHVYVPDPTWGNHFSIFRNEGLSVDTYKYYDGKVALDFEGMKADLKKKPSGSLIVLHATAHNPTGIDPTMDQWTELSTLCKSKDFLCMFDMAYQGFASGDCERDVASVRRFLADENDVMLCQSFAKNFGLYGQRIGTASIVCADAEEKTRVESQMKILARAMYSNPPVHGARIVKTILKDPALKAEWLADVEMMAGRIIEMRKLLREALEGLGHPGPGGAGWQHVTDQIGMFCFSGMTPENVDQLAKDHSIYLTRNGRISMAGVTTHNVNTLASAVTSVMSVTS